jgi:hypothetical protein
VVTLILESRARGLGELYSDPRSIAFLHADLEFQEAHDRASAYARRWHDGCTDVRWTLSHPSCHFLEVRDASSAAGFVLGLMHLLDPSRLVFQNLPTSKQPRHGHMSAAVIIQTGPLAVLERPGYGKATLPVQLHLPLTVRSWRGRMGL